MRQKQATTRGLGLIRSGVPMRHAAVMAGVSLSTLLRACRRHGITLRRGLPLSKTALIRLDSATMDALP
jgi:hypothetical protein